MQIVMGAKGRSDLSPRLGVVTEPLAHLALVEVMDWLGREVPLVTDLEIGAGVLARAVEANGAQAAGE